MKNFNKKSLVLSALLISMVAAPAAQANFITDYYNKVKDGLGSVYTDAFGDGKPESKGSFLTAAKNPWAIGSALATAAAIGLAYLAYKKYVAKSDEKPV